MADFGKDYTVHDQVQRLVGDRRVRPKDIRLSGLAYLLGAAMVYGLGFHMREGWFFPKLVVLVPILLLQGSWWLLDATALAQGRRRHQRAILWGGAGMGFVAGLVVVIGLGG